MFKMLAHRPEVLRTFLPLYNAVWAEGALPQKLLHRPHVAFRQGKRHRFDGLAREIGEQPLHVLEPPPALLAAGKQRAEIRMVCSQFIQQPLDVPRGQINGRERG
jgi:hypothetical protein